MNAGHEFHKKIQLEKRDKFFEKVHAAFVLDTSLNVSGAISEANLGWLMAAYPGSIIKTGNDQGANFTTVTPNF